MFRSITDLVPAALGAGPERTTTLPAAGGTTVIDNGVVAAIVDRAAREVSGVRDLGAGLTVEVGEGRVGVELSLADGCAAPQRVADDVETAVLHALEDVVGVRGVVVDVNLTDVPREAEEPPLEKERTR